MRRKPKRKRNGLSDAAPVVVAAAAVGLAVGLAVRAARAAARPQPLAPPPPSPPPPPAQLPPSSTLTGTTKHMTTAPAPSLSPLAARVAAMSQGDYERFVVAEALAGRVPLAAATMVAVPVAAGALSGVFWCWSMPLCVGPDGDLFHAPLPAPAAQRIADALGLSLPTRRMVDAIHVAAQTRVPFRSYSEGRATRRTFAASSDGIEQRRAGRGGLVSDYAKDYVLSNQRRRDPARITIYGAWDASGARVQPLATPHGLNYYDYSQQPRFVSQAVEVNGARTTLAAALADPTSAALFSDEGVITGAMLRY